MTRKSHKGKILRPLDQMLADVLEQLDSSGIETTAEQAKQIASHMSAMLDYTPKIGVFGKTGVGKSSLCNALFGREVASISDVRACTREPANYLVHLAGGSGLVLVDVPGVGESRERDEEYAALYSKLIPELDVLIWVVKADDRAFTIEQRFQDDVVRPALGSVPMIVAINQSDKIEPVREWDVEGCHPGPTQRRNLSAKRRIVRDTFGVAFASTVCVSAVEKYGVGALLTAVVKAVPRAKRVSVVREATEESTSDEAKRVAEQGFWQEVWKKTKEVVAAIGKTVTREALVVLARNLGERLGRMFR